MSPYHPHPYPPSPRPLPGPFYQSPYDSLPGDVIQHFEKFAAPQPTILTIYLANVTAYYQDDIDLTLLARTQSAPITAIDPTNNKNNFTPLEVVADIVQINDDTTVKGLYISRNLVTKSAPTATPGSGMMISDARIVGFRQDIFKILYLDPMAPATTPPTTMEIGSITAAGVSGKDVPPGGPLDANGTPVTTGGDWAITGGTGAFLGVTGQMGGQGGGGGQIRAASVTEDPSYRIDNIDSDNIKNATPPSTYNGTMCLYVIPLMPPQIIAVLHEAPWRPVTQADPASVGERLTLYATGLGPVRYQNENNAWVDWPIGQPFPANTTVISPVTITVGGNFPFAPLNAQGVENFSNGYSMEFTVPDPQEGTTSIQISSAWIPSAVATLYLPSVPRQVVVPR